MPIPYTITPEQFKELKAGDRFFYNNPDHPDSDGEFVVIEPLEKDLIQANKIGDPKKHPYGFRFWHTRWMRLRPTEREEIHDIIGYDESLLHENGNWEPLSSAEYKKSPTRRYGGCE